MDEKAYASLLIKNRDNYIKAFKSSIKICYHKGECRSCPLYDENMVNSMDTRCFAVLLSRYATKLSQAAKEIEEKGE